MSLQDYIVIITLALCSVLLAVSVVLVFRSPARTDLNVLRVHKGWGAFVLIVGFILAFGGVWSLFYGTNGHPPNGLSEGILITCIGVAFILFMLPSFTRYHDVYWNDDYVEGPNRLFGPTLRFSRTKIDWSDVVVQGQTFTQYHFVESSNGSKIYFSPYSTGLDQLEGQIYQCFSDLI